MAIPPGYDASNAVGYHYGKFPPVLSDLQRLIRPLTAATAALARYDQMLKGMHNSEILLAPMRSQEAVVSSRMEGTISTLDEVLRYEAEQSDDGSPRPDDHRSEAMEVFLYSRAMAQAQKSIGEGQPLSSWLIREAHRILLGFGRGASMSPGEFKSEQNFLADRARRKILFVPIEPLQLVSGIEALLRYMEDDATELLFRTAVTHLEFEALHPFKDGNGRIGRMIIPLMLWKYGAISQPHFYVSAYFETRRDEYIDKMRRVSSHGEWTEWTAFFLEGLEQQAVQNLRKAEEIAVLYEEMKVHFRTILSSQWTMTALDFMFSRPIFRNNAFTSSSQIPDGTAHRFTRALIDAGYLRTVHPASGRRPATYAFEPLLKLVRA